jgi:hypothetical protein
MKRHITNTRRRLIAPTIGGRRQFEDRRRGRLARLILEAMTLTDSRNWIVPRETSAIDYRAA